MARVNRQFVLNARPDGEFKRSDLRLHEAEVPSIGAGEVLLKMEYIAVEPAMLGWMTNRSDYAEPMEVGDVMRSFGVGRVIESNDPGLPVGVRVSGLLSMQEYVAAKHGRFPLSVVDNSMSASTYLGVLGVTGLTAYCGLFAIGKPQEDETVLVSAAAGATGSIVGQLARIAGCRVIGIAGSDEKCDWLRNDLGFDAAINYRSGDVGKQLDTLCPAGIDVYWDNVGGELLDIALNRLRKRARVVLCGGISRYSTVGKLQGPANYFNLVFRNALMQGFLVSDYMMMFDEARRELKAHLDSGALRHHEDVLEGFEQLPAAIVNLFSGRNRGKQVVRLLD